MSYTNHVAVSRLLSSAATTNATIVKAAPGYVKAIALYNAAGSARYLKFYNKGTTPTVGTDTPFLTYYIPAGGMWFIDRPEGVFFDVGISFAITGAAADADTTAIAAGDILCMNVEYA